MSLNIQIHQNKNQQIDKTSVFRSVLGTTWHELPALIQRLHDAPNETTFSGYAQINRGNNLLAQCIATVFNFPIKANAAPVKVTFQKQNQIERWERNFNECKFISDISAGKGRYTHQIYERFGAFTFSIALVLKENKLHYVIEQWQFFSLPLPRLLRPRGDSFEYVSDDKFHFSVEIKLPLIGLIVSYRGWLTSN